MRIWLAHSLEYKASGAHSSSDYVLLPVVLARIAMLGNFKQHMRKRATRRSGKRHTSFLGRTVSLFDIAFETGGHHIVPGVHSATGARNYVIYGQVVPLIAAILADVIVPVQDIATGETYLFVGDFDIGAQPDHRRQRRIQVNAATVILDRLGFTLHQ